MFVETDESNFKKKRANNIIPANPSYVGCGLPETFS